MTRRDLAFRDSVIGSLNVIAAILAVRLILLVAIGGAITLAYLALAVQDLTRLAVLGIYVAGVVMPMIWLSAQRR